MALATNTITRYDFSNPIREDLANVIYNISPTDTVLMTSFGRDKASQTYFEWQTDNLASAVTTNAHLEGDSNLAADARSDTQRVGNFTQISRKVIEVSGTAQSVSTAGMAEILGYNMAKASSELKRDMEATLASNQIADPGSNSVARTTAGVGSWIISNSYSGATGTAPDMSGASLNGYPDTAAGAGTPRAFTEGLLKTAIQGVWTEGATPNRVFVGPYNKSVASSTFTGIATRYRDVPSGQPAQIIGAADIYVSDFGTVTIVASRFQPEATAYVMDTQYGSVAYLRSFQTMPLAKTGDSERRLIQVEWGVKVRQQKAMAAVRDLITS